MNTSSVGFSRQQVKDCMDLAASLARLPADRVSRTEALARGLCGLIGGTIGIVAIVDDFRPDVPWPRQVWGMDFGFCREEYRRHFFASLRDPDAMHPLLEAFRVRDRRPMVARREDLVSDSDWYGSRFWRQYGRHAGIGPMLYTIYPIEVERSPDRASRRVISPADPSDFRVLGIGIHRLDGQPAFTEQDRELIDAANASLAWFYESLGVRDAEPATDLSPRLRRVLEHLLAGQSEKQVARTVGLTRNTVHEYVKSIYRHFGVGSRAELFARLTESDAAPPTAAGRPPARSPARKPRTTVKARKKPNGKRSARD